MIRSGLVAGGVLAMIGAVLPWLTLYAGLQQYSGMVGLYGRMTFALGFIACIAGAVPLRSLRPLLPVASAAIGIVLLALALWLYQGVLEIIHRPDAVMLVAQSGPGLFVILAGGVLLVSAPLAAKLFRGTSAASRRQTEPRAL